MEIQMNSVEKINYISVGKTIGIWVTIDGEQVLFVKETHLREQIAKDIEATYKGSGDGEMAGYGDFWVKMIRNHNV